MKTTDVKVVRSAGLWNPDNDPSLAEAGPVAVSIGLVVHVTMSRPSSPPLVLQQDV
jgi:hypothetical protein